ncbi:hypothetical protein, conserved [Leishmania tarentolae]|uniref:Uncharacterized protein n=1 Tax=Leishmania tarentolae TaxID=5689 RepID=A0A640KD11_LEITA|nr:hypothetical protein, conserved [Leishmania tarentolae]
MTSRVELDFFVPPPERRQCLRKRLAQQRAPMYEWRHDFAESTFDAATGERRPLRCIFNPVAKAHGVSAQSTRATTGNASAHATAPTLSSLRPATAPLWDAAAIGNVDRRNAWKQTGFTFAGDYFRKSTHLPEPQSLTHASASGLCCNVGEGEVYVPYLHDTILFYEPLPRPNELHGGGPGSDDVAAAAADQCPPVQRWSSSTAKLMVAVTYNAAESRAREAQASIDASRAGLLGLPKPSATTYQCATGVDTAATAHAETCCDVAGPSIAAKQRASAMAEGVYTDFIVNHWKARSATETATTTARAELPTCELAYSLRPSYVQSRLRRTVVGRGSSQSRGTAGIASDRYSASLDAGMSGTTQHTTEATSPMTACASAPRLRGPRGNGVSGPPSERAITQSPANDSVGGAPALAAAELALADTLTFSRLSGSTTRRSSTTAAAPPPALSPMELRHDVEDVEEARSLGGVGSRAALKPSPTAAGVRAGHHHGLVPTASPRLSNRNMQRRSDSDPLLNLLHRTSNNTDSPTCLRTCGDAGASTVAGGSNDGLGEARQRRRRDVHDAAESSHQSPLTQRGLRYVGDDALQEDERCQRPFTTYRLPTEAKETRVYAVRMRGVFTNVNASLVKRAEPQRRGIPVMLPPDWQPNC